MSVQVHALAALTSRGVSVSIKLETRWTTEPVRTLWKPAVNHDPVFRKISQYEYVEQICDYCLFKQDYAPYILSFVVYVIVCVIQ
jgi:hypothetical protein